MKLRILRKWVKLAHSYEKYSYKTKDGLYCLVGELTPNQAWLLWGKHRKDCRRFFRKRFEELMKEDD